MPVLRLTQSTVDSDDRFRIEISLEGLGARRTAVATVASGVTDRDQNRIRWYLEEYLDHPEDPFPTLAAGVERRLEEIGKLLFAAIFEANRDTTRLWDAVCDRLSEVRVEISAEIRQANTIPWELLRDPRTDSCLALTAAEFVRVQSQTGREPKSPVTEAEGPVRILLVICRPGAQLDVPFRSVASRLVKGLTEAGDRGMSLEVLRPPTFEQLGRVLRRARSQGKPYHIVHFDGHGLFADQQQLRELRELPSFDLSLLKTGIAGAHGYVCFEDAARPGQVQPIDGIALGNLLYETGVPTLVLNACRSAYAESVAPTDPAVSVPDYADQVRSYGSFAQTVSDAGVASIVAMRYNIYVATAAQFVGELYGALAEGQTVGRAATWARKNLNEMRSRSVAGPTIELQDWVVPVVHEAIPLKLFARRASPAPLFDPNTPWNLEVSAQELPRVPDAGFFGRDETLLALDRAFDRSGVVLMYGYAGSGKTATAAEFARWYARTGGIAGPVLFDSFERYRPLSVVIEKVGTLFAEALRGQGVEWLAVPAPQRRGMALKLLQVVSVLWIWDNIEPVTGFPIGSESSWTPEEQQELADFLRALRDTKTKVLLTSRREEMAWLGNLPARVQIPPMPSRERRQLATALIRNRSGELKLVGALEPLLDFTMGNPLTLTVLVGQALTEGLRTRQQAEGLVERLRAGEAAFDDDAAQGRSRSLGASLAYGFERSFNDTERCRLALLHLFQSMVNAAVLANMGAAANPACMDIVRGLTVGDWVALLDRAAEIGLLAKIGGSFYTAHPALPWFFKGMFDYNYPSLAASGEPPATRAMRAYSEAMASYAGFLETKFEEGRSHLGAEEANLLHALALARRHGWWPLVVSLTYIIANLYGDVGRNVERVRLLRKTIADLVKPEGLGPVDGREEFWQAGLRIWLQADALERNIASAEHIYSTLATHFHARFPDALTRDTKTLTAEDKEEIRFYVNATRLWILALGEQGDRSKFPTACSLGEEAFELADRIGDSGSGASIAHHLGNLYCDLRDPNNVARAEQWYEKALARTDPANKAHRWSELYELAQIRYRRCQNVLESPGSPASTGPSAVELRALFSSTLQAAHEVENALLPHRPEDQILLHSLLGNIYDDAGHAFDIAEYQKQAAVHYQEYITLATKIGDFVDAAKGCREMARLKLKIGELDDALTFAQEAVRKCTSLGQADPQGLALSQKLVAVIEHMSQQKLGGPS